MLWFIDQNISRFRNVIDIANKGLEAMLTLRGFVVEASLPTPKPDTKNVYKVASRSGGRAHYVSFNPDGTANCTCIASEHGNQCWAGKNIAKLSAGGKLDPHGGDFFDEGFVSRSYTVLTSK